jgi:hypothetical protein
MFLSRLLKLCGLASVTDGLRWFVAPCAGRDAVSLQLAIPHPVGPGEASAGDGGTLLASDFLAA